MTTIDAKLEEIRSDGWKLHSIACIPSGKWRAYLSDGRLLYDFGEGATILDALTVGLERVRERRSRQPPERAIGEKAAEVNTLIEELDL